MLLTYGIDFLSKNSIWKRQVGRREGGSNNSTETRTGTLPRQVIKVKTSTAMPC